MTFLDFYRALSTPERAAFAEKAATTPAYVHQVAYGKQIELGVADVFVAVSRGKVTLSGLPLTERARLQDKIRREFRTKKTVKPAKTA